MTTEASRSPIRGRPGARYSLRLRVFLAVALAALSLPLVVFVVSQLERNAPEALWRKTLDATDEMSLDIEAYAHPTKERVRAVADKYKARVRVVPRLGNDGAIDVDRDDPHDALLPFEAFFFLARNKATWRDFDSATPILARDEVSYALARGLYIDCEKNALRVCRAVRAPKDREERQWIVYVDKSSWRAVEEVYFLRRALLRLSLVTVPLALALGAWAARRVTAPITKLRAEALEKASKQSPGADLTEHADEVGDLAEALNALLGAIEHRRAENEAFVADVVHEMKSPVAAVTAIAEALETPVDEARRERLARALGASAKKLDALVTQFLDLARAEAGMPREEREEIALTRLAEEAIERAALDPRYQAVAFELVDDTKGDASVRGVARRLGALVRELVDNAASFAGGGGKVRITVSSSDEGVRLDVSDDGPGIAEPDLARVFQRFFTTRGERRGTGLGLALVEAVAIAHGGVARVESPTLGERGTRFTVVLPRDGASERSPG